MGLPARAGTAGVVKFSVDEHGLSDDRARRYFWARHVEQVGEDLGDLVDGWIPMLEPSRWAMQGWLTASGPPGLLDDAVGFAEALEGALLGSVEAAQRLRRAFLGRPVVTGQWIVPAFPGRNTPDVPPSPDAEAMTTTVDEALFGCWRRLLAEETLVIGGRLLVSWCPGPGRRSTGSVSPTAMRWPSGRRCPAAVPTAAAHGWTGR